jgi:hypothetical protein
VLANVQAAELGFYFRVRNGYPQAAEKIGFCIRARQLVVAHLPETTRGFLSLRENRSIV